MRKGQKYRPEPLTREEVELLVRAASPRTSSGIRMRALVAVLYGSGLRISEALRLRPKDVDTSGCTVRVLNGKGGVDRTVAIDAYAGSLVDAWLHERRRLGFNGRDPLFVVYSTGGTAPLGGTVTRGRAMTGTYARAALARLAQRAGIDKRVHPHGLRHSLAFDMVMTERLTTLEVRDQLGHTNLATTDNYLRRLAPADLVRSIRNRDWRGTEVAFVATADDA